LSGVETRVLAVADDEPTRSFDFAQDDPAGMSGQVEYYYLQKYLARVRLSGVETRVLAVADDEPTHSFDFAQDDPFGLGVKLSIIFNKII